MHPAADPLSELVEPTQPAPAQRAGYPETTLVSLLLMIFISAGTLYAVDWSYREEWTPVYAWSFAGAPSDSSPWSFPDSERTQTPEGIAYVTKDAGPGPVLALEFDAESVRRIRATFSVTQTSDGKPAPFQVEWYWASPEDIAAANGSWPFSSERGATFVEPDRHHPEERLLDLRGHPRWKGKIAKAFIGFNIPLSDTGAVKIETKHIEFLE